MRDPRHPKAGALAVAMALSTATVAASAGGRFIGGPMAVVALSLLGAGISRASPGDGAGPPEREVGKNLALLDEHGRTVPIEALLEAHRYTVLVFYSASCPCFAAHVPRLRALARELRGKDVGFVLVDSERHAPGEPAAVAELPDVDLPLMRDPDAHVARGLEASYATESFVFDPSARLRYRGGIDDDRKTLRPSSRPYLREALQALLEDRGPAFATSKALGCALRLF